MVATENCEEENNNNSDVERKEESIKFKVYRNASNKITILIRLNRNPCAFLLKLEKGGQGKMSECCRFKILHHSCCAIN